MSESDDSAETIRILKKGAEAGDAHAQYLLAFSYEHGLDGLEDQMEAAKWYLKAADQGHAEAQSTLGHMYCEGRGVLQHHAEAVRWYLKALELYRMKADQGDADAQWHVGFMYYGGQGVPKDKVEAYAWLNISAMSKEQHRRYRDRIELTPEEKAQAQQRSMELFNEIEARKKAAGK